jgi:alkylhydroperoxidase/carboxymuconolactone decarboxylase family protein YurZ
MDQGMVKAVTQTKVIDEKAKKMIALALCVATRTQYRGLTSCRLAVDTPCGQKRLSLIAVALQYKNPAYLVPSCLSL